MICFCLYLSRFIFQEVAKPPVEPTREEQLQSQLSQQLNLPGLQDSSAAVDLKPQPPEGKVRIHENDRHNSILLEIPSTVLIRISSVLDSLVL